MAPTSRSRDTTAVLCSRGVRAVEELGLGAVCTCVVGVSERCSVLQVWGGALCCCTLREECLRATVVCHSTSWTARRSAPSRRGERSSSDNTPAFATVVCTVGGGAQCVSGRALQWCHTCVWCRPLVLGLLRGVLVVHEVWRQPLMTRMVWVACLECQHAACH